MPVVMRRALPVLPAALVTFLLLAPVALAGEQEPISGEGLYGETDDKVITNAGFILIAFFPLFILVMSLIQWRLDKRKEQRKDMARRLEAAAGRQFGAGW